MGGALMGKKGSYLGGSSLMGSSTYFAGWGAKKGKRLRSTGLITEIMSTPLEEPKPVLLKREKVRNPPKPSKLVRKLEELRKRREGQAQKAQESSTHEKT
jgi:hypothetical protein